MNGNSCFDNFNPQTYIIELADNSITNDITPSLKNKVLLWWIWMRRHSYVLKIPNIFFSVQSATNKGASVKFKQNSVELMCLDCARFKY